MSIKFKGRLTPHFTAEEYSTGVEDAVLTRESYLFAWVLEDTRAEVGLKFYVNSWYRTKKLNESVGGIPTSNHLRGCACDFHLTNKVTRARFVKIVKAFKRYCKQYKVVGEAGIYDTFIHLGFQNEAQIRANGGKFVQWDFRNGHELYDNIEELKD